jgi:hypothetical protein
MLTTRHAVDFACTCPELDALFREARAHDVEKGGRYDARWAAINVWSHHWLNNVTEAEPAMALGRVLKSLLQNHDFALASHHGSGAHRWRDISVSRRVKRYPCCLTVSR